MLQPSELNNSHSLPKHITALDGIRGLAILLVLIHHFGTRIEYGSTIPKLINAGWLGVDLFFVLSGFLITGILYDSKGDRGYFRNFYMRRTLRIFPLYYGVLIVVFGIGTILHYYERPEYKQLWRVQWGLWLYLTNIFQALWSTKFNAGWIRTSHFWSLAVEEQFYLIWPLVVLLFNRKTLIRICVLLGFSAFALRIVMLKLGARSGMIYPLTPCRMDGLVMGAGLALLLRGDNVRWDLIARVAKICAVVTFAALVHMFITRNGLDQMGRRVQVLGYSLLAVFFVSMIALAVLPDAARPWAAFMSISPLRFLGKYSYGIYVLHRVFAPFYARYLYPSRMNSIFRHPELAAVAYMVIAASVSTAIAFASYHLYEVHFLKLKRYFEPEHRIPPLDNSDRAENAVVRA